MSRFALVVDDDEVISRQVRAILERGGWGVAVCSDGSEAIDLFDRLHRPPTLVVTDNEMIVMHGDELIAELRRRSPHLAIVMMTGDIDPPQVPDNVPVIHKPFRRTDLLDAIAVVWHPTGGPGWS